MGTFNPNGYGTEQIADALKKAYEGYPKTYIDGIVTQLEQVSENVTEQGEAISGLKDRLLTPTPSDANILSITQEDMTFTGGTGDNAALLFNGMIRVVKESSSPMRIDFNKVYIPAGKGYLYYFDVLGVPASSADGVVCTILANDKPWASVTGEHEAAARALNTDMNDGVLRIEIDANTTFSSLTLKPYVVNANYGPWTSSEWQQFFPSLTWLTSIAKKDNSEKLIFDGSANVLDIAEKLNTSSNVTVTVDGKGRITISKDQSGAGSLTFTGISLKAGTYWFNVIGDNEAGTSAMESKLKDGDTVIASSRTGGSAGPKNFTLEQDKSNLSLVIDVASDAEFDSILLLPFVNEKKGSSDYLNSVSWEPFYPSIIDLYRGLS